MKERPILFKAEMVNAIRERRKTQTRRVIKPQPAADADMFNARFGIVTDLANFVVYTCPQGKPGDRLWVRETWRTFNGFDHLKPSDLVQSIDWIRYEADGESWDNQGKIRQSIFMPRWASRILLEITDIRAERLNDIGNGDAMQEGIVQTWGDFGGNPPKWAIDEVDSYGDASGSHIYDNHTSSENFCLLWESINGKGSWDENPWVWVVEFKEIDASGLPKNN
jgi:hypothetical protein